LAKQLSRAPKPAQGNGETPSLGTQYSISIFVGVDIRTERKPLSKVTQTCTVEEGYHPEESYENCRLKPQDQKLERSV
jgi:hypothetical protein